MTLIKFHSYVVSFMISSVWVNNSTTSLFSNKENHPQNGYKFQVAELFLFT